MWKDIPGYEGLYQINEYGDIKSIKYNKIKIPREPDENYLYPYIILYKDAKQKKHGIHRLVAQTFIPNPYNLPVVKHKDNNKLNPHVDNLEWGSVMDNIYEAYQDGLVGGNKTLQYFEIYKDDGTVHEICEGYEGVIDKIEYGTRRTIHGAIVQKSKFSKGPYKDCRVCRINFINKDET